MTMQMNKTGKLLTGVAAVAVTALGLSGSTSVRSCRVPGSGSKPAQTRTRKAPLGNSSTVPRERERSEDGGMTRRFAS